MRYKLLYSNFNKETGTSKVIIRTPLGDFEGHTKIHKEDQDIQSIFQGCRYAEIRAIIKYYKEKLKIQKNKIITLEQIIKGMEKLNNYNKNSLEARYLRKQYYIQKSIFKKYQKEIENSENDLLNVMQNYRKDYEKFIEKISKEKESIEEK